MQSYTCPIRGGVHKLRTWSIILPKTACNTGIRSPDFDQVRVDICLCDNSSATRSFVFQQVRLIAHKWVIIGLSFLFTVELSRPTSNAFCTDHYLCRHCLPSRRLTHVLSERECLVKPTLYSQQMWYTSCGWSQKVLIHPQI